MGGGWGWGRLCDRLNLGMGLGDVGDAMDAYASDLKWYRNYE